ncbi:MAG: SBBP repeat-containing protein, partial [bacterium]|nr:SBBP repeat-containing protein [bacterium]
MTPATPEQRPFLSCRMLIPAILLYFMLLILFFPRTVSALVVVWTQQFGGSGNDRGQYLAVDHEDNILVTGYKNNGANNDWMTIKYNPDGQTIWTQRYNGGFNDVPYCITTDQADNVYVTGAATDGINEDYLTIKYDKDGNTNWVRKYNGPVNNSRAYGVAVDDSGNVFVTGSRNNSSDNDFFTIKYDMNGITLWTQIYDGGNIDGGLGVIAQEPGYIHVTGFKYNGTRRAFFTIKYDAANGNTIWTQEYSGGLTNFANDLSMDNTGNIYVTGPKHNGISYDYFTIKYGPAGNTIWTQQFDGGGRDEAYAVCCDSAEYVYVTGYRQGATSDYFTVKYDSSGNTIWTQRYNGGNSDVA